MKLHGQALPLTLPAGLLKMQRLVNQALAYLRQTMIHASQEDEASAHQTFVKAFNIYRRLKGEEQRADFENLLLFLLRD